MWWSLHLMHLNIFHCLCLSLSSVVSLVHLASLSRFAVQCGCRKAQIANASTGSSFVLCCVWMGCRCHHRHCVSCTELPMEQSFRMIAIFPLLLLFYCNLKCGAFSVLLHAKWQSPKLNSKLRSIILHTEIPKCSRPAKIPLHLLQICVSHRLPDIMMLVFSFVL